jgi:ketopantoate hydroxymethyltransferase
VRTFGEVGRALEDATRAYIAAVRDVSFPDEDHSFAQ